MVDESDRQKQLAGMTNELLLCDNIKPSYPVIKSTLSNPDNQQDILYQWLNLDEKYNIFSDTNGQTLFDDIEAAKQRIDAIKKFRDTYADRIQIIQINQALQLFSYELIVKQANQIIKEIQNESNALGIDYSLEVLKENEDIKLEKTKLSTPAAQKELTIKKNIGSGYHIPSMYVKINRMIDNDIKKINEQLDKISQLGDHLKITKGLLGAINALIDFVNYVFPRAKIKNYTAETKFIKEKYNKFKAMQTECNLSVKKSTASPSNKNNRP